MGSERDELRPSRTGSLFLAYDLKRYKAEARAQVLQQSLYWAGLGDGARAGDVAGVPLPADAAHRAPGARRRGARRGQSLRAQRPQGERRARPAEPRVRRDGARGRRHADAAAPGHRRAQARRGGAAGVGGELPRDLRRGRGRDFRARHRDRRHRRRQSQGLRHVRLHARGVPAPRGRRRSAPASIPTRSRTRWI